MQALSRREILQMGAALAAGFGLAPGDRAAIAAGLERLVSKQTTVLWLQGMSCSGCSVSLLNAEAPGLLELLTEVISLVFHPTLMASQGAQAMKVVDQTVEAGGYVLVLEGSVPTRIPEACMLDGKPLTELLPRAIEKAACVVAAGTCTSFGGIPGAEGNPTGAVGIMEFMRQSGLPPRGRLVNVPGCPCHPECLLTTVALLAAKGYPEVDPDLLAPTVLFGRSVHDECPRFHDWEKLHFAEKFGDDGCLFKLGCLGPLSRTLCPMRQWNGGVSWCVRAGAPCIGCTSKEFARRRDFPFYRKGEQYHSVVYGERDRGGPKS